MRFIEPNIFVVALIRLSIASSQRACLCTTKFKTKIEAKNETANHEIWLAGLVYIFGFDGKGAIAPRVQILGD